MEKVSENAIHKELDLLQACISRMAHNGFIVKGWAILLLSSVFALLSKDILTVRFAAIVSGALLAIWIINAYFLWHERKFRIRYSWVIKERAKCNFEDMYELDTTNMKFIHCSFWSAIFSPILMAFYLSLIIVVIGVTCLI